MIYTTRWYALFSNTYTKTAQSIKRLSNVLDKLQNKITIITLVEWDVKRKNWFGTGAKRNCHPMHLIGWTSLHSISSISNYIQIIEIVVVMTLITNYNKTTNNKSYGENKTNKTKY